MRRSILLVPLIAALSVMACSAEEQGPDNVTTAADMAGEPGNDSVSVVTGNETDRDGDDADAIPAAFHGEWNSDLAACGSGSSDTRLWIEADRLRFYESAGLVDEVAIESARVIEVTADYSGEGQTWSNTRRLSLSEDGDTLTMRGDGASLARSRCP